MLDEMMMHAGCYLRLHGRIGDGELIITQDVDHDIVFPKTHKQLVIMYVSGLIPRLACRIADWSSTQGLPRC